MPDIIQLLPDSVANQIAAGEVVQRPASVLKELVENAIDAGSAKIQVILKDAGKTLIQVIDNGCGMSENDARMCFERHATSKIRKALDLFDIRTMGFRGEAMAAISAIASVELKSKKSGSELGTMIRISGSKVESQEPISCQNGTNIAVKNLFYNVPVRRKFLKSNSTELKYLMEEFQHIALGFSEIEMHLIHNDVAIYQLPASKIYNRILNILGKSASQSLVPIQSETNLGHIKGYVGKPEHARKSPGEQFFFVNNRFMKHPFFYKAVMSAYEQILPQGMIPSFFIYFDVDPATIDINIHPTKTEIKFENERDLWMILKATIKEGLGKHNLAPTLDFNQEQLFDIPMLKKGETVEPPTIKVNPGYNPFHVDQSYNPSLERPSRTEYHSKAVDQDWQKLYTGFEKTEPTPDAQLNVGFQPEESPVQQTMNHSGTGENNRFFQVKGRYILTAVKSGLMLIDQKRAHERILYDEYIYKLGAHSGNGQKLLYPQKVEFNTLDAELFRSLVSEVNRLGFEVADFSGNTFVVNTIPADFPDTDIQQWMVELIEHVKDYQQDFKEALRENLVKSLAKFLSIPYGKILSQEEMAHINDRLFISQMPNITPDGKTIITIVGLDELEKRFK
jgi:DNA mismatch repair protein MutL